MIRKLDFFGSPHVGIFCALNDNVALVPHSCPKPFENALKELDVDVIKTSVSNTGLFGIFCALNNKMIIVPDILEKTELKILRDHFPEVLVLDEKYTALGNLISMNDHGTLLSHDFHSLKSKLHDALSSKVAGSDLVGSSLFVTNLGFLAHADSTREELKSFERVFKVKGDVGTVNFGDPFVKSGIAGNKRGVIVGSMTSGPELNRISDIFT